MCALYSSFQPTQAKWSFCALSLLIFYPNVFVLFSWSVYITLCSSCGGRAHLWKPHLILAILYAEVTMFLFCRVFSDAASRTMPCTRVRGRGTVWSIEPTGTAANTVACRSAWRSAWAVMVSAGLAHQQSGNWILETRTQIKVLHEEKQGQKAAEEDLMPTIMIFVTIWFYSVTARLIGWSWCEKVKNLCMILSISDTCIMFRTIWACLFKVVYIVINSIYG